MNTCLTCSRCENRINASEFSTGYGLDLNDNKVCYQCCGEEDRETMLKSKSISMYLKEKDNKFELSNWPRTFKLPVLKAHFGKHNMSGKRIDIWTEFNGIIWHGYICSSLYQLITLRQTKKRVI